MTSRKPNIYDPERKPDPKYYTRVPDDALEDPRLGLVTQAVFAQLLKRHWTNDQSLKVSQAEIAVRCRMTCRTWSSSRGAVTSPGSATAISGGRLTRSA